MHRRYLGLGLSSILLACAIAPAGVVAQSGQQSPGSPQTPATGAGQQGGTMSQPSSGAPGSGAPPGSSNSSPAAGGPAAGAPGGSSSAGGSGNTGTGTTTNQTGTSAGNAGPNTGTAPNPPSNGTSGSGAMSNGGSQTGGSQGTSHGGSNAQAGGGSAPTTGGASSSGSAGSGSSPSLGNGAEGLPPPPMPAVLPAVPNIAPSFTAPSVGLPAGELVGVQQQPFVGITLQNAISMALARNTDLAVGQANVRINGFQIAAARGAYDVRFMVEPTYQYTVQPPLSPFQAGPSGGPYTQDTLGVTTGVSGITTIGTQYSATVSAQSVRSNNTANGFNPYYPTAITLNVTQPLLRGLGVDDTRRQIIIARANAANAGASALTQASTTVENVSDAYWDLVSAWRNVAIQEEGLREATAQANSNRRLARAGQVAPVDIVEANTQVNVFQSNIFSALQNVQRLQTELKTLLLANPGDPLWTANLVPTSGVGQIPNEPTVAQAFNAAIRNRPELAQVRDQRITADANFAYARDQLKPQLDFQFGYTTNGFAGLTGNLSQNPLFSFFGVQDASLNTLLAGAGQPLLPPLAFSSPSYLYGHINQSFSNLFANRFPTFQTQLLFTLPIGNHTAKANYAAAVTQEQSVSIQQQAVLQRFKSEVLNALQSLRETRYRLISARSAREASERVYLAERRRFSVGTSTTFLVLQRSLDLANNRGLELQAQTDLDKAVVELQRVTGTIFADNNINAATIGGTTLDGTPFDPKSVPKGGPGVSPGFGGTGSTDGTANTPSSSGQPSATRSRNRSSSGGTANGASQPRPLATGTPLALPQPGVPGSPNAPQNSTTPPAYPQPTALPSPAPH